MNENFDSTVRVIARNVRHYRYQRGMSIEELAKASGLNRMTVSDIERGLSDPRLNSLVKISTALDISCSDLLPTK